MSGTRFGESQITRYGQQGGVIDNWSFRITVGLFDADGNQLIDDTRYNWKYYVSCYSQNLRNNFVFELFSFSNPADYVIRSQKKYFDDAEYLVNSGSNYKTGVVFENIEIQDMSENTVLPTARILKIEGTNNPTYSSEKRTCKLTLYTMEEWEALMAQQ